MVDPLQWTEAELREAAEALTQSRANYNHHRELWERDRTHTEAGFEDPSWFDDVSGGPKPQKDDAG